MDARGDTQPIRIGFFLLPSFSMLAYASAVEPLRLANRACERTVYTWRSVSLDGAAVTASNGFVTVPDGPLSAADGLDALFVCGGIGSEHVGHGGACARLRRLAAQGVALGALCTGTYLLARAGVLDGYRCTTHWENLTGFAEEFPHLTVVPKLFEIDRNRLTCSGGTAGIDLMLQVIARQLGRAVATAVSDQMVHHRIREDSEGQRMELRNRLNISHPKLLKAVAQMEANVETPLSCAELAKRIFVSPRQLERLFHQHLGVSPTRYYLGIRLQRARQLLTQTSLSILNVALACGFVSASHFSKCYRDHFERAPSDERGVSRRSRKLTVAAETGPILVTCPDAEAQTGTAPAPAALTGPMGLAPSGAATEPGHVLA